MPPNWTETMDMTATKLERIEEYVRNMSPVVRAAILRSPDEMERDRGWDHAMRFAQQDLLAILEEDE